MLTKAFLLRSTSSSENFQAPKVKPIALAGSKEAILSRVVLAKDQSSQKWVWW